MTQKLGVLLLYILYILQLSLSPSQPKQQDQQQVVAADKRGQFHENKLYVTSQSVPIVCSRPRNGQFEWSESGFRPNGTPPSRWSPAGGYAQYPAMRRVSYNRPY